MGPRLHVPVLAVAISVACVMVGGAVMARLPARAPAGPSVPASREVQAAYDDAKTTAALERHIDDLQIRDASCRPVKDRRYSCQINFVQTLAPQGRLFFTVVTIEESRNRWSLISGLCKSPSV